MAVSEGTGLALTHRSAELDEETATWLGLARRPEPEPDTAPLDGSAPDERWRTVLDLLFPGDPGLESLARALMARDAPLPEQGYELGDAGWQAELAWADRKIAVVVSAGLGYHEATDRDRAYAADGWDARTARQWTADELIDKITAPGGNPHSAQP